MSTFNGNLGNFIHNKFARNQNFSSKIRLNIVKRIDNFQIPVKTVPNLLKDPLISS